MIKDTIKSIPVVFICDSNYVIPTCISILSILNNSQSSYNFFIIGKDLSIEDKDEFKKLNLQNSSLKIIEVNDNKYKDIAAKTYVTTSALYKFVIPKLLSSYDKVIYLDGDTIIKKDLAKLFNINIENYYAAAILDSYIICKTKEHKKLGIEKYFNSGVMLLNCKKMREDNISDKLLETKLSLKDTKYMDQDAFNIVFKDAFLPIDLRYNCSPHYLTRKYYKFIREVFGYSKQQYKDVFKNLVIIHYSGKKPWNHKSVLLQNLFNEIYKVSPWKDISLAYKDKFNLLRFIRSKMLEYKITSKNFGNIQFMKLFEIKEHGSGKKKVYFFGIKIFTYYSRKAKEFKKIYDKRFSGLTFEEIRHLVELQFEMSLGYKLNLDNPQTFSEKLQWYKLYYKNPLLTKCADKYLVREYIKEKIGEEYLIPLLGVYDTFEEIDFSTLPNQFVIKVNWGSGQNIIVKDKKKLDIKATRKKLLKWVSPKANHYFSSFEWAYKDIKPKIIIEQYIEQLNQDLYDYKFFCSNGKTDLLFVVSDRFNNKWLDFYDLNWNRLPFERGYKNSPNGIEKPQNLQEMVRLAEILSKDFPFVRVDFYNVQGKIMFGELTFYPGNGMEKFNPQEYDLKLGNLITLPSTKTE